MMNSFFVKKIFLGGLDKLTVLVYSDFTVHKDSKEIVMTEFEQVETQLLENFKESKTSSWIVLFKLLNNIDKKELYKDKYKNFTTYIKYIAEKLNMKERYIWRILKAGRLLNAANIAVLLQSDRPVNPNSILECERISKLNNDLDIDMIILEHVVQKRESPAKIKKAYENLVDDIKENKETEIEKLNRVIQEQKEYIKKLEAELASLKR